jgi:uncharacterized membrane protein
MSSIDAEGSRTTSFAQAVGATRLRMRLQRLSAALRPWPTCWVWSAVVVALACSPPGATSDAQLDSTQPTAAAAPQHVTDTGAASDVVKDTFAEFSDRVWLEARDRGVEFRAVGQEPGWVVEIGRERLIVLANYAADTIVADVPRPVIDSLTWTTTYRVRTDTDDVRVDIRDEPCADTMSGERFPATVSLVLNGTTYHGCGRTLDELIP